ncbi:MAG: glutamate--cysteine ligase [Pseudomonadota bacterium]|nr:glutamate--cysteine ligase [Pseudomonadota bacterium]
MASYDSLLSLLSEPQYRPLLTRLQRGIEKEGLRCSNDGLIAQTPHPKGMGSALTHPAITTDYSEALLEFITPVFTSAHEAAAYLETAHRFAYQQMEGELIWPASMPCILKGELSIPIADYGTSNLGQLKHAYRHGLWHRYGRVMQAISGIHYNFSLPDQLLALLTEQDGEKADKDAISRRYLGMIRNFRRYGWLLMYLFGASPAVCSTFLEGREHKLDRLHKHTLYAPYATSLRMSDLGYQNNAQSSLKICHNSLDTYIDTLSSALTIPVPEYEAIGMQEASGQYKQLNTNLLQIENEYYSNIRPKRVGESGEKPLESLARAGIQYIEVRSTDVNPFLPLGLDIPQMHFMDIFLTWCALQDSAEIDNAAYQRIQNNFSKVVYEGRKPGLELESSTGSKKLTDWANELLDSMQPLAELMDEAHHHSFHRDTLAQQRLKVADSSLTPSARVLRILEDENIEFAELTLRQAKAHRKTLSEPLSGTIQDTWKAMARDSLNAQEELEQSDTLPFGEYLAAYMTR